MVLSKRERYIVIGTGLVLGLLIADQLVLGPLVKGRSETATKKDAMLSEMNRADTTLKHAHQLTPKWRQMVAAGMQSDPAEAEGRVLRAISDWARECGVVLSVLKPDRPTERTHLPEISFQAGGSGSMESIARLLWKVQNAKIPLRLTEVQLASRKEGTDDLTVQLRLSTVYLPALAQPSAVAGAVPAAKGSEP